MYLSRLLMAVFTLALMPAASTAQQQADTTVTAEIVIAINVEDREPVGGAEQFPVDVGELFGWTRVSGASNTTVEHVWRYQNHELVVPINIGGSPWRAWSTKNVPPEWTGEWTFEVRDGSGNVVASVTFTVGTP
jgi:hypothetical protein